MHPVPIMCALAAAAVLWLAFPWPKDQPRAEQPAQVQTLACVRVKQVADGGAIEYRCEVRK